MGETLREGRLTARAFRRGVRTTPGDGYAGRADPELLALVADPFESVADARERLTALERTLGERGDGRAPFLTVYARVTDAVERGVAEAAFEDPDWVARYLVAFAEHYRAAFERGHLGRVPDPWQLAFDRACSPDTLVDAEQVLLAERYAPGLTDFDASLGRLDEALSMFTLWQGRRNAWRGVVALSLGRRAERPVRWALNTASLGAASAVFAPGVSDGLLERLRAAERGTV